MKDHSLREYERLLASWPGVLSRSVQDPGPLVEDSLVLLDHLEGGTPPSGSPPRGTRVADTPLLDGVRSLIDVGSGGGMPGIPLKIALPHLQVTLLESDGRKAAFLVEAAAQLGIDVAVAAERAESAAHGPLREAFDVAVCRALGSMPVVAELCLPFVRVGGSLLAMRTADEEAIAAYELLGGGEPESVPAPSEARARGVVVRVPKLRPTPVAYPRRPGLPARRPLLPQRA